MIFCPTGYFQHPKLDNSVWFYANKIQKLACHKDLYLKIPIRDFHHIFCLRIRYANTYLLIVSWKISDYMLIYICSLYNASFLNYLLDCWIIVIVILHTFKNELNGLLDRVNIYHEPFTRTEKMIIFIINLSIETL